MQIREHTELVVWKFVAWVLRFLFNSQANVVKRTGQLSLDELSEAQLKFLRNVQKIIIFIRMSMCC